MNRIVLFLVKEAINAELAKESKAQDPTTKKKKKEKDWGRSR